MNEVVRVFEAKYGYTNNVQHNDDDDDVTYLQFTVQ